VLLDFVLVFSEMNSQVTILKILASYPGGIATFDALKRDLEFFASSGPDWSDRTRRLAARIPGLSIFSMGLVERHPHGWQLTNKGQSALHFMEASDSCLQQDRAAERDERPAASTNIVELAPHLRRRRSGTEVGRIRRVSMHANYSWGAFDQGALE
jgi:hypothetical protein